MGSAPCDCCTTRPCMMLESSLQTTGGLGPIRIGAVPPCCFNNLEMRALSAHLTPRLCRMVLRGWKWIQSLEGSLWTLGTCWAGGPTVACLRTYIGSGCPRKRNLHHQSPGIPWVSSCRRTNMSVLNVRHARPLQLVITFLAASGPTLRNDTSVTFLKVPNIVSMQF